MSSVAMTLLSRGSRRLGGLVAGARSYSDPPRDAQEGRTPTSVREQLSYREGEWRSKLGLFASETPRRTILSLFQKPVDWSPGSMGRWWTRKKSEAQAFDQRFIPERHKILGSNLATAHFVVARGGAVRFQGSDAWVRRKEDDDELGLPRRYEPGMFLEAVDASGMELRYEGLDNFTNLQHLRWLRLAGSPLIDDWFLDRLSGLFKDTVQHLDIADCANVTERGLCALYRMNTLRTLKVGGPATTTPEFQLACLMLEEMHPDLHVHGITYLSLPDAESPPSSP